MQSPNPPGPPDHPSGPIDEFDAIEDLRARFEASARASRPGGDVPPSGDTWIGDDAAVVTLGDRDRRWLMATDLVVAGVHFELDLSDLEDVGYKALMVTISDFAAMGARPAYALASVAAPAGTELGCLGAGLAEASRDAATVVVGGDLSESPVLVVSTAAFGDLHGGTVPLLRSSARPGHHLFVTGPLGRSAAGLRLLRRGGMPSTSEEDGLIRAHRRPVARVAEGEVARVSGADAAIDLSDGLASDAIQLARSSGVGIALHDLPVAAGATRPEALHGGEDYELLIATGDPDGLIGAFGAAGLAPPLPVGSCTAHLGEYSLDGGPLPPGGWRHRF